MSSLFYVNSADPVPVGEVAQDPLRFPLRPAILRASNETNSMTVQSFITNHSSDGTFNGWANWETWNVALWIQNDQSIYNAAKYDVTSYQQLVQLLWECGSTETRDGCRWDDSKIDGLAINAMMSDL